MSTRYADPDAVFARGAAVTVEEHELDAIAAHGLTDDAVRMLLYMHDIEFHTACYLRDLLVTRAHADPLVSAFMMRWGYEETHHGLVIAKILRAVGQDTAGAERVAMTRSQAKLKSRLQPLKFMAVDLVAPFPALHMTEGAVNEWTAQSSYRLLARRVGCPTLTRVLGRIIRQEGAHAAFYAERAREILAASRRARALTRARFGRKWEPVGADVVGDAEVDFASAYLFSGDDGLAELASIDRKLQQLPGMASMAPLQDAKARRLAALAS